MHAEQIEVGGHFLFLSERNFTSFRRKNLASFSREDMRSYKSPLFNTQIGLSTALFLSVTSLILHAFSWRGLGLPVMKAPITLASQAVVSVGGERGGREVKG